MKRRPTIHPNTLLTVALVCAMCIVFVLVLPEAVEYLNNAQDQMVIRHMNR